MADRTGAVRATESKPQPGSPEEREALQAELDRREQEILRLRDLLLLRDAELGAALGRLAELEDLFRRLLGGAARVPGVVRLTSAALRRLPRRGRSGE